jgi:hypothetical protein
MYWPAEIAAALHIDADPPGRNRVLQPAPLDFRRDPGTPPAERSVVGRRKRSSGRTPGHGKLGKPHLRRPQGRQRAFLPALMFKAHFTAGFFQ